MTKINHSVVMSLFEAQVESRFLVFGWRSIAYSILYERTELSWPLIKECI